MPAATSEKPHVETPTYTSHITTGFREIHRLRNDRIGSLDAMARAGVDVRGVFFGKRRLYIVNHPDLIRDVLITNDWNFIKGRGLQISKPVMGQGLLTSEGELHRRQRRLVQPAFHHQRLAGYARTMVACADEAQSRWKNGETLALDKDMSTLTLRIVGLTLFSADLESDAGNIGASLTQAFHAFHQLNSPLAMYLSPVRNRAIRSASVARESMRAVIQPVIAAHRERPDDFDDMLSMLIGSADGTELMSDELLQDEVLTLFLAGHETTATALGWAWWLLAEHPEVVAKLEAELKEVLNGRTPQMEDLPRLVYIGRVFREVLRMYPPVWFIVREAVTAFKMGDIEVPAGSQVTVSPYVTHHDVRFWEQPEVFRPERWETITSDRNGFTYFPFAAGTRNCVGENFAVMEGVLLLATIAQKKRFERLPGQSGEIQPHLTLRPKHPLMFRVVDR